MLEHAVGNQEPALGEAQVSRGFLDEERGLAEAIDRGSEKAARRCAELGRKRRRRNAVAGPQAEKHRFAPGGCCGEYVGFLQRRESGFDAPQVAVEIAAVRHAEPKSRLPRRLVRPCSQPQTQDGAAFPVAPVVHRLAPRPREARHLVVAQARGFELLRHRLRHGDPAGFVGESQLAAALRERKGRVGLDAQRVGGYVVGDARDDPGQIALEGGGRLIGDREHQVDRDAFEAGRRHGREGRFDVARAVTAPEPPQREVLEGLDAERDPVHPGVAKSREATGLGAGRVGFERDFFRSALEVRRDRPEQSLDGFGAQ